MKAASQRTKATMDDAALEQSVEQRPTQLTNQGRFVWKRCKFEATVDCTTSAPYIKHDAHSFENNKNFFGKFRTVDISK